MNHSLPSKPSLENLRKQAKSLLKSHRQGVVDVCGTLRLLGRFGEESDEQILSAKVGLQEIEHALALQYGFKSWKALGLEVERMRRLVEQPDSQAHCVPSEDMEQHRSWMHKTVAYAKAAGKKGEAPIAAVVVQHGAVLGIGHNTKTSEKCGFRHAELNALLDCASKLGRRPEGVVLYSTLEPCAMCLGAIIFSGIRTVVYGAEEPESGAVRLFQTHPAYSHWMPTIIPGVLRDECEALKRLPMMRKSTVRT